jgi:hypothetical protein
MTNREWLLNKMQNMSDERFAEILTDNGEYICDEIRKPAKECINNCTRCVENWLNKEHKERITLPEAERIILENINKEYSYIARNQNGDLEVFLGKPFKATVIWNSRGFKYCYLTCFNHLFQFITWEDSTPYNIAELLEEK